MYELPSNLLEAEKQILSSLIQCLNNSNSKLISVNLRFEGLKLLPLSIRLFNSLRNKHIHSKLIWPDAGATALAKREAPELVGDILSFKEALNSDKGDVENSLVIAVSPQHYDYEQFYSLCDQLNSKILMVNGKLDDASVGIGSVARERRKAFISKWDNIYWLEPLEKGALMHSHGDNWNLFKSYADGYRFHTSFDSKPNSELIFESFLD